MMQAIIHGILLGFGLVIGMLLGLVAFVRLLKKIRKEKFDTDELIKSFRQFESELQSGQHYELIPRVREIIEEIKKSGKYSPSSEAFFIIKSIEEMVLRDGGDGESAARLVTKYKIELKAES